MRLVRPQTAHVGAREPELLHLRDDHRRDHRHDFLEHLAAFLDEELVGLRPRLVDAAVGAVEKAEIVADIVREDGLEPGAEDIPMAGWSDALFLRSEEHTSELQSLMRISYAVFCL